MVTNVVVKQSTRIHNSYIKVLYHNTNSYVKVLHYDTNSYVKVYFCGDGTKGNGEFGRMED